MSREEQGNGNNAQTGGEESREGPGQEGGQESREEERGRQVGEHRAQRIWRDLRVDRVSGGTDEMMILTASKFELKKYRD